ncbi:MAG: ATP-binding cassette domain-containing protein, partial [Halanaerobiales bacterium]
MPEKVINIENLNYSYKNQKNEKALKNINLSINEGDFIVVMGHSGAGKSTLCFSLNGLIPNQVRGDYDGKVEVRGIKTEKR